MGSWRGGVKTIHVSRSFKYADPQHYVATSKFVATTPWERRAYRTSPMFIKTGVSWLLLEHMQPTTSLFERTKGVRFRGGTLSVHIQPGLIEYTLPETPSLHQTAGECLTPADSTSVVAAC